MLVLGQKIRDIYLFKLYIEWEWFQTKINGHTLLAKNKNCMHSDVIQLINL